MEQIYDDLGQLTLESEESMQDEVVAKAIQEGEDLRSLDKHPGWLIVKNTLQSTIDNEKHSLLFATAVDYIYRIQASIRARQELLDFIQIKILESNHLLEEATKAQALASR